MKGEKGEVVGGGYYDQRYGGIAGPPGPPGPQVRIKGSLCRSKIQQVVQNPLWVCLLSSIATAILET